MSFQQGFAWWSFAPAAESGADLLRAAAAIGYRGVDFLPAEWWPVARDLGLDVVIIDGHEPLEVGFNDPAHHAALSDQVRAAIERAATADVPFVAVASGDRRPHASIDGMAATADGLAPLAALAHQSGVVLLIEPLNSKVDHPGHECDTTAWAASVVRRVGSPGLRVLYDFYHAQIMEGDLLRTVDRHWVEIAHFHTAGVPGRHELDEAQEINWPGVATFLRERRYAGYITHEFIPRGDPAAALTHAFATFAPGNSSIP